MGTGDLSPGSVDERAFTYAWQFFSIHAAQRMQAVNFYLISATFLVAAYVAAIGNSHPSIAAGVAVLGVFSSFAFYRIERRIRGLIQAAEAALRPMEQAMSDASKNPALRILERVEGPMSGAWHYSKVFRLLYLSVGLGFLTAALYAVWAQLGMTPSKTELFPIVVQLAAGVVLLTFAYETWNLQGPSAEQAKTTRTRQATEIIQIVVGLIASAGGLAFMLCAALRLSRV